MDDLIDQMAAAMREAEDHPFAPYEALARAALAAIAAHPRYELVEIPEAGEWTSDGEMRWNDYPFVALTEARVAQGGIIAVGPKCEERYFLNPLEARLTAANLLAAAKAAEEPK